ncbi:hypothetical protein [Chitinophaga sp. CF418]|uniref:hypothetical protein n=1 Tax=Chitinophaga sp. CF418 TaxID=1855287 RepID=UPI000922F20C|nr:hypothetical protein [Chitinophaga sp. CF418]SHN46126.1 hypothetical protein SAMN05216311_12317 [Chitinophaga sp. CF418]
MDAANSPVTIKVKIDGKKTTYTGTADNVMVDATKAFNNSQAATGMDAAQKSDFINNKIGMPALKAMSKNIKAAENSQNKEADANVRASNALGDGTIKYNNGSTDIIFNSKKLKAK